MAAGLAALGTLVCACAKKASSPVPAQSDAAVRDRAIVTTGPGDVGLEVTLLSTAAEDSEIARALLPYLGDLPPIPGELMALWRAHGLRLVCMPVDRLGDLRADLGEKTPGQQQWLGLALAWTEAARGPEVASQTIALESERLELGPGRLRLLTRCWIVPIPTLPAVAGTVRTSEKVPSGGGSPAAAMHLELLPQHQETRRGHGGATALLAAPDIAEEDDGMVFSRLLLQMTVPGGRAYVIVPERPEADWGRLARTDESDAQPEATGAASASNEPPRIGHVTRGSGGAEPAPRTREPASSMPAGPDPIEGPPVAAVPTLGEAMLGGGAGSTAGQRAGMRQQGSPAQARPRRTIVLLIPHVPERYRLVGGSPRAGGGTQ